MSGKPKAPRQRHGGANLTVFGPYGNTGRWTGDEQGAFLDAIALYKNDYKKVATMLPSRTLLQIRTHAQKHFKKEAALVQNRENKDRRTGELAALNSAEIMLSLGRAQPDPQPNGQTQMEPSKRAILGQPFPHQIRKAHAPHAPHAAAAASGGGAGGTAANEKKKRESKGLRVGRWTKQEEAYAKCLIEEFR
jgi:SHAQKYF class myb-like DNA-binding protein